MPSGSQAWPAPTGGYTSTSSGSGADGPVVDRSVANPSAAERPADAPPAVTNLRPGLGGSGTLAPSAALALASLDGWLRQMLAPSGLLTLPDLRSATGTWPQLSTAPGKAPLLAFPGTPATTGSTRIPLVTASRQASAPTSSPAGVALFALIAMAAAIAVAQLRGRTRRSLAG